MMEKKEREREKKKHDSQESKANGVKKQAHRTCR